MAEYVLKPPKEVAHKSATNPNVAARVGAELAQRLRSFCASERVTMESAMQVAIAEFLDRRLAVAPALVIRVRAVRDAATCSICVAMDGLQIQRVDSVPWGSCTSENGCRCVAEPVDDKKGDTCSRNS